MTPLRGRDAELARVEAVASAALDGAGGVAVVEGAAGIGKSRLLAEAGRHAAAAGLLVASDGADELDQVTSWGMLLRALSSSDPPIMTAAHLESARGLTDQRLAVLERMRAALEQAAARQPVLHPPAAEGGPAAGRRPPGRHCPGRHCPGQRAHRDRAAPPAAVR